MHAILAHPSPPGETVHGMAARYRVAMRSGRRGPGGFFGHGAHPAASLLPTRLSSALAHIPKCLRVDPTSFIRDHTALPFFTPFIEPDRAARAIAAACDDGSLHLILGTAPNGPLEAQRLRLCPRCVDADIRKYGFAFWHREHQFAFVLMCHRHGAPLRQTDTSVRQLFCSPSFYRVAGLDKTHPIILPADPAGVIRLLARDVASLLEKPMPAIGMARIHARLHALLSERGCIRLDGSVKITRLSADLTRHFGQALLNTMGCALTGSIHSNWIAQIVRRPRGLPSPLKIMLLARFLGISVRNLLLRAASTMPRHPRTNARPHPFRIRSMDRLAELLPAKRREWLALRGGSNTAEKRRVYGWLWRNAREWLLRHRGLRTPHVALRRSWPSIDAGLARIIRQASTRIRRYWPPVRASRHRLASSTRHAHYLLARDGRRLPLSLAALGAHEESAVAYSCRRVRTIARIRPSLRCGKPWRILVAAGIGRGQARRPEVRRVLATLTRS